LLAVFCCAGCGYGTYEERLKQTSDYFAYHELLNKNLTAQPWSGSIVAEGDFVEVGVPPLVSVPVGVTMRVPIGFSELQGARQAIADANNPEIFTGYTEETRHPTYLGTQFQLPGIVEAWEKRVDSGLIRLYFLGNYEMLLKQKTDADSVDPTSYYLNLEDALSQGLGVGLVKDANGSGAPSDMNVFYAASYPNVPGRERFQSVKDYDVVNIAPPLIEGIEYRAQLYEVYKSEDVPVKAALLCIYPAVEHSNIIEQLELALETLSVGDQAPSLPGESDSGGGF
jgi:hypothetical protein